MNLGWRVFVFIFVLCIFSSFALARGSIFERENIAKSIPMANTVMVNGQIVHFDQGPSTIPYVLTDVDGDGVTDIIRKEPTGKVYSFKNYGTTEKPAYREGILYNEKISFPNELAVQQVSPFQNELNRISLAMMANNTCQPGEMLKVYNRFDICVDINYYNYPGNAPILEQFFTNFEKRYEAYENFTGWSFEENVLYKYNTYGVPKYLVVVNASSTYGNVCWYGLGAPGISINLLYYNLSNPNACAFSNFDVFNGTPLQNNSGELGQRWRYMTVFLHEAQHSTSIEALKERGWITEGNSIYIEGNILANYYNATIGQYDISHATADTYIYQGDFKWSWDGSRWGFLGYIYNDYLDTCNCGNPQQNWPIQDSSGYYISGWMFSLMRDNHNLNWSKFYQMLDDNSEILDRALYKKYNAPFNDKHYIDAPVLDILGRASGMDYETQIIPRFRYDGPNGPGWGFREWRAKDYPDLLPQISFSNNFPYYGQTVNITINITNPGNVTLRNISVKVYEGVNLLDARKLNATNNTANKFTIPFTINTVGSYSFKITVDEENIKIERSEANNNVTAVLNTRYTDILPTSLSFSDADIYAGEPVSFSANVSNTGGTSLTNVSVRFYKDADLISEQFVNLPAFASVTVVTPSASYTMGNYSISVKVDESNAYPESNETNNNYAKALSVKYASCGDLNSDGHIDIVDVVLMVGVAFRSANQTEPLWVWNVNGDAQGAVDVIDVVKVINVAFRAANEATEFTCDSFSSLSLTEQDAAELNEILTGYGVNADLEQYVQPTERNVALE
ncbi:hypothetical protein C4573_07245 [Candidatus Woesearchaeota archaeon]|nr:MAG: hypothetical protein C4573_07245 [Candidatus Woesearchaeota archaeon]